MDGGKDGSVSPCRRLVRLSQQGDAAFMQEEVLKLQEKHGRESIAREIVTCEFGDRGSKSALHHAALLGRAEVIRILLEAGGNPSALDDSSNTPLHHATVRGHARATYLLLQAGANQNIGNGFGSTPVIKAEENEWDAALVRKGKEYIRRMFQQGFQAVSWDELPPEEAERKEPPAPKMDAVVGIWAKPAPFDLASTGRGGALGTWAKSGQQWSYEPSDVSTTCTEAVDVLGAGHRVRRPLLADLVRGSDVKGIEARLAETFLQGGRQAAIDEVANCEEDDQDSRVVYSALHVASYRGSANILRILLATHADPNLRNDAGDTPLHFAARRGDKDTISVLLIAGADRNIMNNFGRLPNLPSLVREVRV